MHHRLRVLPSVDELVGIARLLPLAPVGAERRQRRRPAARASVRGHTPGPTVDNPRTGTSLVCTRRVAGLPRCVINVHERQVFHLVFGEAEMD
jgi:hypothetical protein